MESVAQLRRANTRLPEVLAARDAEVEVLRLAVDVEIAELRAAVHALILQVAQLQRRLDSGSDDSGTPTSKESISAKTRRRAEPQARQEQQERERDQRGGSSLTTNRNHGLTVLDAITRALTGRPWLPIPATAAQPHHHP